MTGQLRVLGDIVGSSFTSGVAVSVLGDGRIITVGLGPRIGRRLRTRLTPRLMRRRGRTVAMRRRISGPGIKEIRNRSLSRDGN